MPNLDVKFSKLKTNATRALDKDPAKRALHNEDSFHIERTQEITLEQQIEQQIEIAEEIEEANELALVEGCPLPIENLVTYTKFEQQYKAQAEEKYSKEGADNLFAVYKQEFFANLPNAIKFLSPEAAEEIAKHLPQLASLNKDNLPQGFFIQETASGELVLNFDKERKSAKTNPFTPEPRSFDFELSDSSQIEQREQELNTALSTLQPEMLKFLEESYLKHFPERYKLANGEFYDALKKINAYQEPRLSLFKQFLKNTGSSQHDLAKTVEAFDYFWQQLETHAKRNKTSLDSIPATWTTPPGGNPIVYMERLLHILKNASNLADQIRELKTVDSSIDKGDKPLSLNNYGAYYASHYEAFKLVSADMGFEYNSDELSKIPFSKDYKIYDAALENNLLNSVFKRIFFQPRNAALPRPSDGIWYAIAKTNNPSKNLSITALKAFPEGSILDSSMSASISIAKQNDWEFYQIDPNNQGQIQQVEISVSLFVEKTKRELYLAKRFVGQNTAGISLNELRNNRGKNDSSWEKTSSDEYYKLFIPLFCSCHERYQANQNLNIVPLSGANRLQQGQYFMARFSELYKAGIYLNINEVNHLIRISALSGANATKLDEVFKYIKNHPKAVYEFLNAYSKVKEEFKTTPESEDITYYRKGFIAFQQALLLENEQTIETVFKDEILPFLMCIKEGDKLDLNQLKLCFNDNIDSPNFQSTVRALAKAGKPFSITNFYTAVDELKALNEGDFSGISAILKDKLKIEESLSLDGKKVGSTESEAKLKLIDYVVLFKESVELNQLQKEEKPEVKAEGAVLTEAEEAEKEKRRAEKQKQEEQRKEKYAKLKEELKGKSIGELIKELGAAIPFSMKLQDMVSPLGRNFDTGLTLKKIVRSLINSAVIEKKGIPDPIILSMMEKIDDFKNIGGGSFESVIAQINALVPILVSLAEKGVINELKTYPLSQLDGEKFKKLIEFLDRVGDRESSYQSLINALWNPLLKQSDDFDKLTNKLHQFIDKKFPAAFIGTVAHWLNNTDDKEHENLIKEVVKQDVTDPIFISIMQHPELEAQTVLAILALSKGLSNEQKADVAKMLNLEDKTKLATFLASFATVADEEKPTILAFLGKAFNNSSEEVREKTDYKSLIEHIQGLDSDKKKAFLAKDCFDLAAVDNLSVWLKDNKIADIPDYLEKNPHGKRDDAKHFGLDASGGFKEQDHLERIVNSSRDLSNDSAYSYQYRKQMMEAFLFINEIGHSLPAYKNKPIKDCTNAELKGFFQELKDNKDKGLSPFQKRLIAIAIIRETIYRTTGKFPHSTQIIALIDSIMHEGDFISQINTGEGKSMIDCMKASLLWLDSDRVDLTTSSIEDARRDIAEFKPFFELLEIPVSTNPISASRSGFADYKTDGINFSTVAQLSLFFAKARVSDEESAKNLLKEIDDPNKSVSLVLNESDYALLDDSVIYRLAMGIGGDLGAGGWVYKSINKFVGTDLFLERMASGYYANAGELVEHLKKHLASLKSDPKFKDKLDEINEEQYLDWIEASFIANFQLNEHEHFVVEEVVGTDQKAVKLLMRDGKVSPDSNFGKGVQQFLTARMAELYPGENFHIKPETKAIISSNNKNFIDSYRMRERGFIWGGSGTPGSKKEIEEQEQKYGFEFAKLEPHKEKRVEEHQVAVVEGLSQTVEDKVIVDYEEPHFIKIYERLLEDTKNDKPCLVFFKDNTTANRFNDWLTAKGYFNDAEGKADATRRQVYTGSTITEAEVVKNAGKKGMITITTSAIGRNTDIKYQDPRKPNDSTLPNTLVVIHSFIDSTRVSGQKSGRTGRQGSKGDVYYIVSEKDLPKGTKAEDLREQMDEKGRLEREENEQFYNMMGLLFNEIKALPEGYFKTSKIDFIKQNWREFAAKAEENYHNRGEVEQSNDDFMQQRLVEFHDLMKANLKDESLFKALSWASVQEKLSYQHEKAERYEVYDKKVRVEDCTPPREIAYHLVHFEPNLAADKKAVDIENAIRVKLAGVFQDLDENKPEKHQDTYLKWLSGEGATREIVVKAHREFLQERFNTLSGKEANVFQRLFGYKSNLKKMVDNSSYLVLFHSLTSVSHDSNEQTEVDIVKKAAERLLQDYLDTAWFIKGNRKQWALDTIAELKGANTIDDVTAVLIKHQMAALADDMGESKNLHKGGQSRYLDALERSLRLAASFKRDLPEQAVSNQQRVANGQSSDKKEESATHKALKESIEKYNALPQRANEKPLTPDTFKEVNRADLKGRDKAAAKALASILELQSKKKTGMVGRNSKLFKERAGKEKAADDASADGIPDVNKGP